MSRTLKDSPYWVTDNLPKHKFTNSCKHCRHWCYETPCWWNHMTTTKRKRAEFKNLRATILNAYDLEELDIPTSWNKPREYYW